MLKGITGRRQRGRVVEALLRQTNLEDVRTKKLGGYSGGMRQRFGVAVALLGEPELIIVDEPTAGIDPAERVRFLNLLSEIGEQAVVILSTHIVEDVTELCSRMAVIDRGTILLEADPAAAVGALRGRMCGRHGCSALCCISGAAGEVTGCRSNTRGRAATRASAVRTRIIRPRPERELRIVSRIGSGPCPVPMHGQPTQDLARPPRTLHPTGRERERSCACGGCWSATQRWRSSPSRLLRPAG